MTKTLEKFENFIQSKVKPTLTVEHEGQSLEISTFDRGAIEYGAMKIDWDPPYPELVVTTQLNPNWDPTWPEQFEHVVIEQGGRKVNRIPKYVPLKMNEYVQLVQDRDYAGRMQANAMSPYIDERDIDF